MVAESLAALAIGWNSPKVILGSLCMAMGHDEPPRTFPTLPNTKQGLLRVLRSTVASAPANRSP